MKSVWLGAVVSVSVFWLASHSTTLNASENESATVKDVCEIAGEKVGLESAGLATMTAQCTKALAGKFFETDNVLSDEDAEGIESRCVDEAQEAGEDDFDKAYESCATREVIAALKAVAQ
ncbi:MAG: hypothetical protein HWE11_00965 [Gammaproteobacteria bacterium]|nr:hypothetical protein [Gammaproteobacteria bacterium]